MSQGIQITWLLTIKLDSTAGVTACIYVRIIVRFQLVLESKYVSSIAENHP